MLPDGERQAWLNIVKPAELDIHMASIGQAEANAAIVREMFDRFPLTDGARLLVHGCGSCQMVDYLSLAEIGNVDFTFADLSPVMLEEGKRRLDKVLDARYRLVIDDIERSTLTGPYDAVLLVLVLLHVQWRISLTQMMGFHPSRFYIVDQEQMPGSSTVTTQGELLPSMRRYREVAGMELVPRQDLITHMSENGYRLRWTMNRLVPGDKTMVGFVFEKD